MGSKGVRDMSSRDCRGAKIILIAVALLGLVHSFAFAQTGFDEEFGQVVTFSLSGSVTGFVTPVR